MNSNNANLCQYFTPNWVAEEIVERFFPDLDLTTQVIEPSCGPGAFVNALAKRAPTLGVELDPNLASFARVSTGAVEVVTGDFRTAQLPATWNSPHAICGNPPFVLEIFEGFLERAYSMLKRGAQAGFIVPAYFLQTSRTTDRLQQQWGMHQHLLPRDIFPGLSKPLLWVMFRKDACESVGFLLYREVAEVKKLAQRFGEILRTGTWRSLVRSALEELGGTAHLEDIYRLVLPKAPSTNSFPKAKIRQALQRAGEFKAMGDGIWSLV